MRNCSFFAWIQVSLLLQETFCVNRIHLQGSKLGWSCGPSLLKLLSDHQIVLGGGPVVTGKITIKGQYFFYFKVNWHRSFLCLHIFFSKCYVLRGLFKCFMSAVFDLTNKYWLLATSGPPEIWQYRQISRTGGPMVNCLEMLISSPDLGGDICR